MNANATPDAYEVREQSPDRPEHSRLLRNADYRGLPLDLSGATALAELYVARGVAAFVRRRVDDRLQTATGLAAPGLPFEPAPSDLTDDEPALCCEGCGDDLDPDDAVVLDDPDEAQCLCGDCALAAAPEIPAELLPVLARFAAAWDARSQSLARVAEALAPGHRLAPTHPAGCRVQVTFGPDAGQVGTVVSGPDAGGYYSVRIDGRPADEWGELWYFLPEEIALTTTPPAQDRPWANDAAYAAEGLRLG